ncbi:hypothetical protein [Campylobacter sp. JMF_03 NE3]|uniref:hypothetical protein n=1 Tax=Campylobacter sp. JMF_03 NE3 TaxID=2983831 RepID=UPI0022E9E1B9|nr:hypothetical protein [Campylobacter sp. JMF_03 NE3]MDA3053569.1 hypothetical protein [Campylobacter sp. JMF_03 NE3]
MKIFYKPLKQYITEKTTLYMPTGNYRKPYIEYSIELKDGKIFANQNGRDCIAPFRLDITNSCKIEL